MQDVSKRHMLPAAAAPSRPRTVDRASWQAELDALLVREKAHTRAGDAIAAGRSPSSTRASAPQRGHQGTSSQSWREKGEDIGGLVSAPRSLRAELRHQRDLVEHRPFFLDQPAADAKV